MTSKVGRTDASRRCPPCALPSDLPTTTCACNRGEPARSVRPGACRGRRVVRVERRCAMVRFQCRRKRILCIEAVESAPFSTSSKQSTSTGSNQYSPNGARVRFRRCCLTRRWSTVTLTIVARSTLTLGWAERQLADGVVSNFELRTVRCDAYWRTPRSTPTITA